MTRFLAALELLLALGLIVGFILPFFFLWALCVLAHDFAEMQKQDRQIKESFDGRNTWPL